MDFPTAEQMADGEAHALSLIAYCAQGDWEFAVKALRANADNALPLLMGVLNQVYDILREHGTDPAEWVERKQAEYRARLADGDGG